MQPSLIQINHSQNLFYQTVVKRPEIINVLIYKLIKIIDNIISRGFCFANLRPENILLSINPHAVKSIDLISDIKIIDFSQIISINNFSSNKIMENQRQWFYMPPEITEILLR